MKPESKQPTLSEVLASLGLTHEPATGLINKSLGRRNIYHDGVLQTTVNCWECWEWLRYNGLYNNLIE